jgi:hypothetical protein
MHRYAERQHLAAAGVARARTLGACAMPAASWQSTPFIGVNSTDTKPAEPRPLLSP